MPLPFSKYKKELPEELRPQVFVTHITYNITVENMDSKYHISGGQQGAVGDNARAEHFTQMWASSGDKIDLATLASELKTLRAALREKASDKEHYESLGEVVAAEKAATEGNGPGALEHLKKVGAWVWDVATKIGVGVAITAAKTALGI